MTRNAAETCGRTAILVLGTILVITILIWPAILNGFPIVYDDTSAYIGGVRKLQRFPVFYNVLPLLARLAGTLWVVVLAQAIMTACIVARSLQLLARTTAAPKVIAVVAVIAMASQLPWLVSYLMPDLFGGLGLLALIAGVLAWSHMVLAERVLCLAVISFSALVATANTLVFLPVAAGLLIATAPRGRSSGLRRSLVIVGAVVLVLPITSNWLLGAGPILAGGSSARMFSKLVDNGLAVPYLEQHCAKERFHACEDLALIRTHIGDEGFLWKGPANAHGHLAWKDVDGDYARLTHRIMLSNPIAVARFMIRDSAVLVSRPTLVAANTGEIAPHPTGGVPFFVHQHFPNDDQAFALAKQQQGSLAQRFPKRTYVISTACSFLFTLCCLWLFWRDRDRLGVSVTLWILIAVAFAIVVHGSLSYPVPRYNVKFSWLLWIVPAVWLLRSPFFNSQPSAERIPDSAEGPDHGRGREWERRRN